MLLYREQNLVILAALDTVTEEHGHISKVNQSTFPKAEVSDLTEEQITCRIARCIVDKYHLRLKSLQNDRRGKI